MDRETTVKWVSDNHADFTGNGKGVGRANTLARDGRQRRPRRVLASYGNREPDPYLESLADRARAWREIHVGRRYSNRVPIDVAATMLAAGDREAVLVWLRAGMPYTTEGEIASTAFLRALAGIPRSQIAADFAILIIRSRLPSGRCCQ